MRHIAERILFGICILLLTATSSNAQAVTKETQAPNKEATATPKEVKAVAKEAKAEPKTPVITCTEKNGLTVKEIERILIRHNEARLKLQTPAIAWDCTMAQMAQEWATRGVAEHRPDNYFGENLFVSSDGKAAATQGVKRWVNEKKNFAHGTTMCKPGKMCLHYTQVVAPVSIKLGCGINRSATGKWKLLMVCNYDPNGNGY
ncbi:MAG: CAP domain-containing protein [Pyrinomonadaceae bacterium]